MTFTLIAIATSVVLLVFAEVHFDRNERVPTRNDSQGWVILAAYSLGSLSILVQSLRLSKDLIPGEDLTHSILRLASVLVMTGLSWLLLLEMAAKIASHFERKSDRWHPTGDVYAYSLRLGGKIADDGVVRKGTAVSITQKRFEAFGESYTNTDVADVDATFGFARSPSNSLEFYIMSTELGALVHNDCEGERGRYRFRRRDAVSLSAEGATPEFAIECVEKFFDFSPDEFATFFIQEGAEPTWRFTPHPPGQQSCP